MRNKSLKNKAIVLFMLLYITLNQVILAQKTLLNSDSLLVRLRTELKLEHNNIKISVDDFLPDCWIMSNKSGLLVRSQQADGKKVTELLIAIISLKKGELYDKTKALYDEFTVHYQKECLPLLKDYDNLQICRGSDIYIDFIANQCQILGSFEFALTSLMFAKESFTPEQIYLFEKKQFFTWKNLIQANQKTENVNFVWNN